jgi:hypothetical protein
MTVNFHIRHLKNTSPVLKFEPTWNSRTLDYVGRKGRTHDGKINPFCASTYVALHTDPHRTQRYSAIPYRTFGQEYFFVWPVPTDDSLGNLSLLSFKWTRSIRMKECQRPKRSISHPKVLKKKDTSSSKYGCNKRNSPCIMLSCTPYAPKIFMNSFPSFALSQLST